MPPIRVLIVDDSELIRSLLAGILSEDPELLIVGTAVDPYDARKKIKELDPDVITLDIEMPKMDGITFLRNLMRLRPMPVVMVSTLTTKGAEVTLEALELGAIDFITKPKLAVTENLSALSEELRQKVKHAAKANLTTINSGGVSRASVSPSVKPSSAMRPSGKVAIIAIGASTGGTEATKTLLSSLPPNMPPIVVAQHMPDGFTRSYADRLDHLVDLAVSELNSDGQLLEPNHVYIANGARHFVVRSSGGVLKGYLDDSAPVNRHKPSVDVLFNSVANAVGSRSVGVLLTGMGADGAKGLGRLQEMGAKTVAQDERTSVVWGMPRIAIEHGYADEVLPLGRIGEYLIQRCYRQDMKVIH